MPKMVNKEEKIDFICDEAYKMFADIGIEAFSLNQFIVSINMSKGQFYHYFSTKEQLIYQVMSKKVFELNAHIIEVCKHKKSFMEKLNLLFAIYMSEEAYYTDFRKLMVDTMHLYINSHDSTIREFNTTMYQTVFAILDEIFDEEIQKDNFHKDAKSIAKSICATADGMFLQSLMVDNYDLKVELSNYFLEIEKLLKKK
ncbi:TetR/AcrR family transcriptional regulator [Sulfurospirillum deleyianum]|uniref:Regulatory protein TetR n=1 Tax=Sulfurospirillum deleyianum (strain ATCC 51133 / DSM 6946 / 5175) TaxID=525898 RepID=D1B534_SULD5|nr:TetR/AcrR family transcriptional regulator [Sulfurospirillum deleyianum]ACZ13204.1 regulatory protein TetR [Sulfurospirillum deleyianum DSM 6946]